MKSMKTTILLGAHKLNLYQIFAPERIYKSDETMNVLDMLCLHWLTYCFKDAPTIFLETDK